MHEFVTPHTTVVRNNESKSLFAPSQQGLHSRNSVIYLLLNCVLSYQSCSLKETLEKFYHVET